MLDSNAQPSTPLQTIEQLLTELTDEERTDYAQIINSIDIPNSEFLEHASWSEESYTRNCIYDCDELELILLCWEEGQVTPIHDDGGEECWVRVVHGELRETIFQTCDEGDLEELKSTVAKKGDVSYMVDFMGCHRLENVYRGRSMSLHLYAKPIRSCKLFDEELGKFVRKQMVYDTVSELDVAIK